jgi:hypothetical protein
MSWLALFGICLLAAIVTLASYMRRVYSEFGKISSREVEENLDAWEERVEPRLGLSREHAALCAAVLEQLALVVIALEFGALLFDRSLAPPTPAEVAQAVLGVVLVIVICGQLLPSLLFNRSGCCSGLRRQRRRLSASFSQWPRWPNVRWARRKSPHRMWKR